MPLLFTLINFGFSRWCAIIESVQLKSRLETPVELNIFEANHQKIAEIISDTVVITTVQDALDLMVTAGYEGARDVIFRQHHLPEAFFDLRTGLAGEILQKYVNYQMRLAVIGDFETITSKSLRAFILESNRGKLAFFAPDKETAIAKLTG
jgi:hypothetical protein